MGVEVPVEALSPGPENIHFYIWIWRDFNQKTTKHRVTDSYVFSLFSSFIVNNFVSNLCYCSGQTPVLLHVRTKRVRTIDGGRSLVSLHLNRRVESRQYMSRGKTKWASGSWLLVPGTLHTWWCSEYKCYSAQRLRPPHLGTTPQTAAPDQHTHTQTHTTVMSLNPVKNQVQL